jgi:hypothetical protein
MIILILINNLLAIALPSLRISPLIRIATIVLLYAAALSFSVVYIQSIGLGIGVFSGLFHVTLISQSIEIFFKILDALILMPWSLTNSVNLFLEHLCSTGELAGLLLSSLVPIKPSEGKPSRILTKLERQQFTIPENLKEITIGLLLGDLFAFKQKLGVNASLCFSQGLVHEAYLNHLYELFASYCLAPPKIIHQLPHKKNGKVYSNIRFQTLALPCFTELYDLFYPEGKKVISSNLGDLLTPLGLAYWAMDDGTLVKNAGFKFCTDGYTIEDVKFLSYLLNTKFDLKTTLHTSGKEGQYRIYVPKSKLNELFTLISPHIHQSMKYKINSEVVPQSGLGPLT